MQSIHMFQRKLLLKLIVEKHPFHVTNFFLGKIVQKQKILGDHKYYLMFRSEYRSIHIQMKP